MPTYVYQGRSRHHGAVSGELTAGNPEELTRLLRKQGILVTSQQRKIFQLNFRFGSRVRSGDLTSGGSGTGQPTSGKNTDVTVVVSAMSGVTDQLISAARSAARRSGQPFHTTAAELRELHLDTLITLVHTAGRRAIEVPEPR